MRNLLVGLSLLIGFSAAAAVEDWETFEYKDRSIFLRLKSDASVKVLLMRDPNGAKIVNSNLLQQNKQIEVIEYFAGEHGTTQNVRVYHAALYNTATKKFLGEYPLRYEAVGSEKQPPQPVWTANANSIKIFIPDTGKTETVTF